MTTSNLNTTTDDYWISKLKKKVGQFLSPFYFEHIFIEYQLLFPRKNEKLFTKKKPEIFCGKENIFC